LGKAAERISRADGPPASRAEVGGHSFINPSYACCASSGYASLKPDNSRQKPYIGTFSNAALSAEFCRNTHDEIEAATSSQLKLSAVKATLASAARMSAAISGCNPHIVPLMAGYDAC